MASKTTFTCDRCSKTGETSEFLRVVQVRIAAKYRTSYSDNFDTEKEAEWCAQCLNDTGLQAIWDSAQKAYIPPPELPPSIEDLIRQIVREEIPQVQS